MNSSRDYVLFGWKHLFGAFFPQWILEMVFCLFAISLHLHSNQEAQKVQHQEHFRNAVLYCPNSSFSIIERTSC